MPNTLFGGASINNAYGYIYITEYFSGNVKRFEKTVFIIKLLNSTSIHFWTPDIANRIGYSVKKLCLKNIRYLIINLIQDKTARI